MDFREGRVAMGLCVVGLSTVITMIFLKVSTLGKGATDKVNEALISMQNEVSATIAVEPSLLQKVLYMLISTVGVVLMIYFIVKLSIGAFRLSFIPTVYIKDKDLPMVVWIYIIQGKEVCKEYCEYLEKSYMESGKDEQNL